MGVERSEEEENEKLCTYDGGHGTHPYTKYSDDPVLSQMLLTDAVPMGANSVKHKK